MEEEQVSGHANYSKLSVDELIELTKGPDQVVGEKIDDSTFAKYVPYVPQKFWFNSGPDPEKIQREFPGYDAVMYGLQHLNELDYEEVCKLSELFEEFKGFYQRRMRIYFTPYGIWPQDTKDIADRKKALAMERDPIARRYYSEEAAITMTEDEEVNGYQLHAPPPGTNIMDYESFTNIWKTWNEPDMTEEEFRKWFDENACTDWAKQDRDGECYGGFWRAEEGSPERENAWQLSRDDNLDGLCELPYPRRIIMKTVQWGCGNRMESVRYSNFMCEWIKRKAAYVYLERGQPVHSAPTEPTEQHKSAFMALLMKYYQAYKEQYGAPDDSDEEKKSEPIAD